MQWLKAKALGVSGISQQQVFGLHPHTAAASGLVLPWARLVHIFEKMDL